MIFDETCQSGMEAVVVEKSFAGGLLRVVLKACRWNRSYCKQTWN